MFTCIKNIELRWAIKISSNGDAMKIIIVFWKKRT